MAFACLALAGEARAQRLILGGSLGGSTGVEGGDAGQGTQFRRARTHLELSVDGRIDEDKRQGIEVRAFAEIEPHASVGLGVRYLYWLTPSVVVGAGGIADLFPRTLFGVDVAVQLRLPFPSKNFNLMLEPSFAALPLGADIQDGQVILWGLLKLGFHADL